MPRDRRRIQALGMAADAPAVIVELQEALFALGAAMDSTEAYVQQAGELLNRVLPELTAALVETGAASGRQVARDLNQLGEARGLLLTDRQMLARAEAEVDAFLSTEDENDPPA